MGSRSFASLVVLIAVSTSQCLAQDAPAPAPELDNIQRIALCKAKAEKPLEPSDIEPVKIAAGETRPLPIHTPWPQFSARTRPGNVVLEGIIDEDGCIREAKVLKGGQEKLDKAALKAVKQWVFKPYQVDGKVIRVRYYATINYER